MQTLLGLYVLMMMGKNVKDGVGYRKKKCLRRREPYFDALYVENSIVREHNRDVCVQNDDEPLKPENSERLELG